MTKSTRPLRLRWYDIVDQNPWIEDWMDSIPHEEDSLTHCWNYIRERRRDEGLQFRPRRTIDYFGRRIEITIARLLIARRDGEIGELDAAHLCFKNKRCINPDHITLWSRPFHQRMDKRFEHEIRRMLERCPEGQIRVMVVPQPLAEVLPEGWPSDDEMQQEEIQLPAAGK